MRLGLVTIGQAPRADLSEDLHALLPAEAEVTEHGALDGLTGAEIAALAPRPGESALTSRLRDGGSAVFGHDQAVPLVEQAVGRAEASGADATLLLCSGEFPAVRHGRPLFLTERLAHDATASLLRGLGSDRLGIVRPLPEQTAEALPQWGHSIGVRPVAVSAASPYTGTREEIASAAREVARTSDLVVLDCIGFDEEMRRAAVAAGDGTPVVTVRGLALRVLSAML